MKERLISAAMLQALSNPWAYQALGCYDSEKIACQILDEGTSKETSSVLKEIAEAYSKEATEILVSFARGDELIIFSYDPAGEVWAKIAPSCVP